ncbi:MAG: hypothetical protein Q8P32_04100 [Candidatus Komeilibacteria bacterium]|nr:hypothetical protein [Candidatus Komeilibacteria bacterium]
MKIYFHAKESSDSEQQKIQRQIIDFLENNGVLLLSNLIKGELKDERLAFENMDGLVIEGKDSAPDAGYLIALALAQGKRVLFLLPKGSILPDQLRSLQENGKLKKLILLRFYTDRTLINQLVDFIDLIETGELRREVPSVKFTLRFTPRADRYLTWLNRKKKIKKADFLRQLIDESIKNDEEYHTQLR